MTQQKSRHYVGHRQRLKNKLLEGNVHSLADYELIELILFISIPRRDVKPLAKILLNKFKNIACLLNAPKEQLLNISGVNNSIYTHFTVITEIIKRSLKYNATRQNTINSRNSLIEYLKYNTVLPIVNELRILFLNTDNTLIADEAINTNTSTYQREVIKRALIHNSSAIIIIHNNLNSINTPSISEIKFTKTLTMICNTINIKILDHIIIANNKYYNFEH